jgi:exodeoxyribonuclease VII small subunit
MDNDPALFESALAQLEQCVDVLEQGGLSLETAIERFEAGMRLAAQCEAILDQAELRVTHLLADTDSVEPAF